MRYALGGILHQRDLAAIGADQTGGCNSKPLIGIQPLVVVERPELERVLGQALHGRGRRAGQRRHSGVVQVNQVFGDRKLVPVLPPEWLRRNRHGTGAFGRNP